MFNSHGDFNKGRKKMKFIELISMKGTSFSIPSDNIKEVCAVDNHSTISTHDNNCYDCQFSYEHVMNLINYALLSDAEKVMLEVNARRYDYLL